MTENTVDGTSAAGPDDPAGSAEAAGTPTGATGDNGESVSQNPEKDPSDWVTGDEPMTGPQASYLATLAQEAGEPAPPETLTKAEASERIDALQAKTGRGA